MKTLRITVALAVAALAAAAFAHALDPPNFDFFGNVPSVPSSNGQTLRLYSVLTNNGNVPTPIPLDFQGHEHTLVVEATLSSSSGMSQSYTPATVRVYTDAGPATTHDFTNPASFQDGTLILSGVFTGGLVRDQYTTSTGSFVGHVDWTGGSRLGELGGNTSAWSFGGGIHRFACPLPAGFIECWDGLINQNIVAVEERTWGSVKSLYERP